MSVFVCFSCCCILPHQQIHTTRNIKEIIISFGVAVLFSHLLQRLLFVVLFLRRDQCGIDFILYFLLFFFILSFPLLIMIPPQTSLWR